MSVAEKLPSDVPDDRDLTPLFYSRSSQSAARDSLVRSGMGLFGPLAPVFDQELYVAGEDDLVVPVVTFMPEHKQLLARSYWFL